jgi:hypothetical protein
MERERERTRVREKERECVCMCVFVEDGIICSPGGVSASSPESEGYVKK